MLRDRWSCSTGHKGREDANLWGNLQGPLRGGKIKAVLYRLTVLWHLHVLLYLALYSACDA